MTRICLVRHGETDWNKETRLQGRTNTVLNQAGVTQARKVGEYLGLSSWDKIISSPLQRAKESANIIAFVLGIEEIEIEIDEGLIERNYGVGEGLTLDERLEKHPDRLYEGMEEWHLLRDRLMATVRHHAEINKDKNIIMVSHGGAINAVLYELTDGKYGSGKTKLHMGSINMLTYEDDTLGVELFNYKSY